MKKLTLTALCILAISVQSIQAMDTILACLASDCCQKVTITAAIAGTIIYHKEKQKAENAAQARREQFDQAREEILTKLIKKDIDRGYFNHRIASSFKMNR